MNLHFLGTQIESQKVLHALALKNHYIAHRHDTPTEQKCPFRFENTDHE